MLFDTHTHLNEDEFTEEERLVRAREIEESDVELIIDVGYDEPSSVMAVEHAKKYPWCYAAVGMHPHDSKLMDEAMLERFRELALECPKVKAIGEIGLDFHYDLSDRDVQRHWFRRQIRLANELKLPIVVHAREADREVFDILHEEGAFSDERKSWFAARQQQASGEAQTADGAIESSDGGSPRTEAGSTGNQEKKKLVEPGIARVDIHCFSGSAELALEYIKDGAMIGVDGPLTYKNNKKTVRVVEEVPLEYLMAETDAPYLTPVPFRGKPNKSPYVEFVVRKIAEIKGITYEEAARVTCENGKSFFGI